MSHVQLAVRSSGARYMYKSKKLKPKTYFKAQFRGKERDAPKQRRDMLQIPQSAASHRRMPFSA
jgi:hypothetical protein